MRTNKRTKYHLNNKPSPLPPSRPETPHGHRARLNWHSETPGSLPAPRPTPSMDQVTAQRRSRTHYRTQYMARWGGGVSALYTLSRNLLLQSSPHAHAHRQPSPPRALAGALVNALAAPSSSNLARCCVNRLVEGLPEPVHSSVAAQRLHLPSPFKPPEPPSCPAMQCSRHPSFSHPVGTLPIRQSVSPRGLAGLTTPPGSSPLTSSSNPQGPSRPTETCGEPPCVEASSLAKSNADAR